MKIINRISVIFSTFFFLGYSPVAPGTAGTAGAVLLYLLTVKIADGIFYAGLTVLLIFLSIIVSNIALEYFRKDDPGEIVIDEVAGFMVTMLFVPFGTMNIVFGFFLFRIFDILKPYPVRKFEKLPKGYGVVLDDVAAGVYACGVLHVLNYLNLIN